MISIRRFVLIITMAAFVAFLSACGNVNDLDGDGVTNSADVDADGDGLIEIATAQQFNQIRYNLSGSSFKTSAAGSGDATGCGNGNDITACNGYELTTNIDLSGMNWEPIGRCPGYEKDPICIDNSEFFNGIFDGNRYEIRGLSITNVGNDYVNSSGLFGAIGPDAELRNVRIRSASISGGMTGVGMLVGYAESANIIDSFAEGEIEALGIGVGGLVGIGQDTNISASYVISYSISAAGSVGGLVGVGWDTSISLSNATVRTLYGDFNIGGLVGFGLYSTISSSCAVGGSVSGDYDVGGLVGDGENYIIRSSCAAFDAVNGTDNVGGLVGLGVDAIITSSYATGSSVNGNISVGGLVGNGTGSTITSSYATGSSVSGNISVGGLVGDGAGSTIRSSYTAVGAVNGMTNVGGLVGDGDSADITYSYWDVETTGIGAAGFGRAKTTDELQGPETPIGIYLEWANDMCADGTTSAWDFGTASQYPALNCTPNGLDIQRIQ